MTNPIITARNLHRLLGMVVFMATLVPRGRLRLRPVQWWAITAWCQRTGNWSDRIIVPQWVLSEVAWWSSLAVLQGLPLASRETEVTIFTDASSSGWGAQLGSHVLNTGTVICISKIVTHKRAGDAGRHQRCESLPSLSEIPGVSLDVQQRCDSGVHQERGGHTILHSHATDNTPAEVVRSQGNKTTVKCHYNTCHYDANASLTRSILGSQTSPTCPYDHPRVAQHMGYRCEIIAVWSATAAMTPLCSHTNEIKQRYPTCWLCQYSWFMIDLRSNTLTGFPQLLKNHWNSDLLQDHWKIIEFHEKFLKFVRMTKSWKNHWILDQSLMEKSVNAEIDVVLTNHLGK